MPNDITIRDESIELDKFLKLSGLCDTGGQAKYVVQSGFVTVNGEAESRRRRKLVIGDVVEIEGADAVRVARREA